MSIELDHVFVCTAAGGPEAERLIQFGLHEGPANQHPGQGTASRRFAFFNTMIELVWVNNLREVQSQETKRTLLWERWSGRMDGACPFGICMRPADAEETGPPFASWEYRPAYLTDPLVIHVGEAGIEEPMWVYLSFLRRAQREQWFVEHSAGIRAITGLTLTTTMALQSDVSQKVIESGILTNRVGDRHLLEIEFDDGRLNERVDFRPHLPFVFHL
jgi:hypothetical protein